MSRKKTQLELRRIEKEIGAVELMSGFTVAANEIHKRGGRGMSYYLISLDSTDRNVSVTRYDRMSFNEALKDYKKAEIQNSRENEKKEVVLVSAGKIDNLKKAYPNFFLDTSEFVQEILKVRYTVG